MLQQGLRNELACHEAQAFAPKSDAIPCISSGGLFLGERMRLTKPWLNQVIRLAVGVAAAGNSFNLAAENAPPVAAASRETKGQVVVAGVVPDQVMRAEILTRVRDLYGADRIVDQLSVDNLPAPPHWMENIRRLLDSDLKQVRSGQLRVSGTVVELSGTVPSEEIRAKLLDRVAFRLKDANYTVHDELRSGELDKESVLGGFPQRMISFGVGNAVLTAAGSAVLDELLPLLKKMPGRRFEIIGHTDDSGTTEYNLALSKDRAEAVKTYLAAKGIPLDAITTFGVGSDRPLAPNNTAEGRARNRRIEFRVPA